jgi:hypothetical protein
MFAAGEPPSRLVTSRKPDDLAACCAEMVPIFSQQQPAS